MVHWFFFTPYQQHFSNITVGTIGIHTISYISRKNQTILPEWRLVTNIIIWQNFQSYSTHTTAVNICAYLLARLVKLLFFLDCQPLRFLQLTFKILHLILSVFPFLLVLWATYQQRSKQLSTFLYTNSTNTKSMMIKEVSVIQIQNTHMDMNSP